MCHQVKVLTLTKITAIAGYILLVVSVVFLITAANHKDEPHLEDDSHGHEHAKNHDRHHSRGERNLEPSRIVVPANYFESHEVKEKMAWIALSEFGIFISLCQIIFGSLYWKLATTSKKLSTSADEQKTVVNKSSSSSASSSASASLTIIRQNYIEKLWFVSCICCIFSLIVAFALSFCWYAFELRPGINFIVFITLDFFLIVTIVGIWFTIEPPKHTKQLEEGIEGGAK